MEKTEYSVDCAYHEAAHATVAFILGAKSIFITINPLPGECIQSRLIFVGHAVSVLCAGPIMDSLRNGIKKKHDLITAIFVMRASLKDAAFLDSDIGKLITAFPELSSSELRKYIGNSIRILRENKYFVAVLAERLIIENTITITQGGANHGI